MQRSTNPSKPVSRVETESPPLNVAMELPRGSLTPPAHPIQYSLAAINISLPELTFVQFQMPPLLDSKQLQEFIDKSNAESKEMIRRCVESLSSSPEDTLTSRLHRDLLQHLPHFSPDLQKNWH